MLSQSNCLLKYLSAGIRNRKKISPSTLSRCRLFSNTIPLQSSTFLHHEWIIDGKVIPGTPSINDKDGIRGLHNGRRTVIFLHGLLGSGKNLRNPAKKLTQSYPDNIAALLLDLRGHGNSNHDPNLRPLQPPHTIHNCAFDIIQTMTTLGLTGENHSPIGCVGHSFGGRCALQYLHTLTMQHKNDNNAVLPPKHTWLLDTVPGRAHGSVANVVSAVSNIDMAAVNTKQDLVKILTQEQNIDKSIAAWMTTNLKKSSDGSFEFMFDLNVVESILNDFPKQDFMSLLKDSVVNRNDQRSNKVYLVMAGKNQSWTDDIVSELQNLKKKTYNESLLELVTLSAGHWVHVDDLDGLMKEMNQSFDQLLKNR